MRISKDPAERMNEIIDAAEELFNTKGFDETAISDIVKKIGVAQGTFYYYFKSKDEVANAIIDRDITKRTEAIKTIVNNNELNSYQKLAEIILLEYRQLLTNYYICTYIHHENNLAIHQKFLIKKIKQFTPLIAEIITDGVNEGYFNTEYPSEVTEFLLIGIQSQFDPGLFTWNENEYKAKMTATGDFFERVLGAKKDSFRNLFVSLDYPYQNENPGTKGLK